MIKKIYETKEHVVTEKICTEAHMYCDICGKTEITGPYWKVHTFHNDWGNDSCESHEYFDVCSPICLQQKVDEYIKDSNTSYNTKQIEIEHTRGVHFPDVVKIK